MAVDRMSAYYSRTVQWEQVCESRVANAGNETRRTPKDEITEDRHEEGCGDQERSRRFICH